MTHYFFEDYAAGNQLRAEFGLAARRGNEIVSNRPRLVPVSAKLRSYTGVTELVLLSDEGFMVDVFAVEAGLTWTPHILQVLATLNLTVTP